MKAARINDTSGKPGHSNLCGNQRADEDGFRQRHAFQFILNLPGHVQRLARKNFELFKANPRHPSLGFQKKGGRFQKS